MADTRTRIINLPEATTLDPSMNFVEDSADGSGTRRVTYDTLKGAINQEGAVNLAPAYSNAATYNVGDLCTYQGTLYSCNTQISTAEDWTAAHWTLTNMASDLYQLKSDLNELNNTLSVVIDNVDYKLERKAIYIYPTYSFTVATDSTTRISTTPIYVAAGESVRIKGYGFGKYARNLSDDGETISVGNGFVTSDTVDISYYGPIWVRLTFAFADDSDITLDDVNITITKGYSGVVNKYVVDAFGKVVNTPEYLGDNIVTTNKHMYVRNNNGVLQLSKTGGESWNSGIDVTAIGLIKTYHLFDNGCIAFFTHQKAYYSEDWATYHEADVYEADGVTPYAPSAYDNFTLSRDHKTRMYVGTQDAFVFGNYGITDEANTRRIIWATLDNGHTYKVIYEFNIDGAYRIRHVHNVIYSPDMGYFLCAVGDSSSESRVIKISYNVDTSVWSFESLGNGLAFKWAGIAFYGAYVYFCYDNTPGKVCRCKFTEISDVSKHETILDNLPNDAIGLYIGERGDMLVTLSFYRSGITNSPFEKKADVRRLYYSADREEFVSFMGLNPTNFTDAMYYGFMPLNDDGRIMTGMTISTANLDNWNKLPSVSLDAMVKQYGYPNAFKPYDRSWEVVPVIDVECDDISVGVDNSTTITPKLYPWNASSLAFEIVDYNTNIITVSGATITGRAIGTTTAKVRSKTNYEAYAEITVTVV